ncbi:MAG: type II secretion system protein [Sulfurimonas sp.]|jgi:prepilin-type N-terminal cleavage/methylation domain-containing protein|uniref:pilus assembly FimT family protein n=1 Tax=Sulfurimonas sp. TaxID=2022749 RepID=UPI002616781D|nr:type II secretion system protein [Sulfurimonas sp.]MDD3476113.1 type II secretion system protein [Sulfurimonas sp.]
MKKAFTMMELIFVIVVISILAAIVIPRTGSDKLQEAATQVVSHIRYTQHLAMVDDKFDVNDADWYRERWQIRFRRNSGASGYVIFSDSVNTQGNVNNGERAIDPLTGEGMDGFLDYKDADLTRSYNIVGDNTGIVQSCFTADGSLVTSNRGVFSFDHLGRPYSGVSNSTSAVQYLITGNCDLTLTDTNGASVAIRVHPESGYACILDKTNTNCL